MYECMGVCRSVWGCVGVYGGVYGGVYECMGVCRSVWGCV